ncbi:MAG: nuclease-related domain-containing protein [Melioribacteraceae bacterium]|nr:nuclease-related domain-containing protein [Melioribacteraceae bacterium]
MFYFFILIAFATGVLSLYIKYKNFTKSSYQAASGNSFWRTILDKGNSGEYLTYVHLEKVEGHHRILTNLYIPKKDGSTTEIDVVMIAQSGIYVFESKNYSGWIFGSEKSQYWTQTFPNGQKQRFYNPISQNKGHIKALQSLLEIKNNDFFKSYIVFSERCTLKKIDVNSSNIVVLNRNVLRKIIKRDIEAYPKLISISEVNQLALWLEKYTLADEEVKRTHVNDLRTGRL